MLGSQRASQEVQESRSDSATCSVSRIPESTLWNTGVGHEKDNNLNTSVARLVDIFTRNEVIKERRQLHEMLIHLERNSGEVR